MKLIKIKSSVEQGDFYIREERIMGFLVQNNKPAKVILDFGASLREIDIDEPFETFLNNEINL